MAHIEIEYVDSSNLSGVGYDPSTRTMRVEFHSGGIWDYKGVPVEVYHALMGASSKGGYYAKHVKGLYEAERVQQ